MIKVVKFLVRINFCPTRDYLPLGAIYLYKIINSLNVFFSEIACPLFTTFHTGPSFGGMLKICSNGSAPLIKMAAMPIYGKTLKIFFSSTKKDLKLNLGIQYRGLKVYLVFKMMRIG